jgi:hypothetical protein
MFADHFEPLWNRADCEVARQRVNLWRRRWPEIASRHSDSAGRSPRYTFFYPEEEYHPHLLDPMAEMADLGLADVEVHIHHDGEGQQNFVDRIGAFTENLARRHGLLHRSNGRIWFGFIHGNWALDNSLPDGRWCGLNNEITLLRGLGCYGDFTLPSAPSPAQTRMINTIYWAKDDPSSPKSHDTGIPLVPGEPPAGDLLMIPGPLGLNWKERRRRWLPRLETGELAAYAPPSPHRARLWLRLAPRLGDDVFLKLFTHGAQERNSQLLLDHGLDRTLSQLREECARNGQSLYFVSAWEMYSAIEGLRRREDPLLTLTGACQTVSA